MYVKIVIKPGDRGNLEISMPDVAIKTRALRVIIEVDDSIAEVTPANNAVKLKTPRGEYCVKNVEIVVRDLFSVEEKPPDIIIRRAIYVY
jgi:hypothetical protein